MDLYQRYGPALLRKAGRLLGNQADAQDVVQGLFVEMLRRGDPRADLPYLYRAVTNRCLNLMRDHANRERLLARQDAALRGPVRTRCDEEVLGVDLVCKLLGRLDERCSEVLVYRYFDDLTQDEIAALQDTSRKTVGHRLDRIREAVVALREERP
jgi:RNA polymerase sigma-70 factor (ECF subfamily)